MLNGRVQDDVDLGGPFQNAFENPSRFDHACLQGDVLCSLMRTARQDLPNIVDIKGPERDVDNYQVGVDGTDHRFGRRRYAPSILPKPKNQNSRLGLGLKFSSVNLARNTHNGHP